MSTHGREVLLMMKGGTFTQPSLLTAIKQKFGEQTLFHTCSVQDLNAEQLIELFKKRGKFYIDEQYISLNEQNMCSGSGHHQ